MLIDFRVTDPICVPHFRMLAKQNLQLPEASQNRLHQKKWCGWWRLVFRGPAESTSVVPASNGSKTISSNIYVVLQYDRQLLDAFPFVMMGVWLKDLVPN